MLHILTRRVQNFNFQSRRTAAVDLAYKIEEKCSPESVPLLFLHGLLSSKKSWEKMPNSIAKALNTCAVTVDMRNHGQSPHVSTHSYTDLASDVSKLLDTLKYDKATLIGHSMGGRTAMTLALSQPRRIDRLVVIDISPISCLGLQNNFFPRLLALMHSIKFDGIKDINKAKTHAKDKILKSGVIKRIEGVNFLLTNLGERHDNTIGWVCNVEALMNEFDEILKFPKDLLHSKFDGPTLFIGGQKSKYLPKNDLEGIRKLFPKAILTYIPGVGHNVYGEAPDEFVTLTKNFLLDK